MQWEFSQPQDNDNGYIDFKLDLRDRSWLAIGFGEVMANTDMIVA